MKLKLFLFGLLVFGSITAQNNTCDIKINVDTEEEIFKLTQEQLVEYLISNNQTVFLYFSLMRENDIKSLVLQVSLNSAKMPPVLCFNKDSRITFKLSSGDYVPMRFLGEKICGRENDYENSLKNTTSEGAFLISPEYIPLLKEHTLESMRLTTFANNFDIVFQELISNSEIKYPIYPKEFFIKNLECIE